MNRPPKDGVRVDHEKLRAFVDQAGQAVGLPAEKAGLLAELLVANELRGVNSHGTQQISAYTRLMREGKLNPKPQVEVVRETPTSVLIDGDGGLGYFPAYEGTQRAVEKARQVGMATMVSRNHGHFGAAGIYARLPLADDMIVYVTSGHQLHLQPGQDLLRAGGGSPMAFSAPAGEEEDLVLDFGTMHGFYSDEVLPFLSKNSPGMILTTLGLGEFCQVWGGLLSGLGAQPESRPWSWPGANQGALVMVVRVDLFNDPAVFKGEVDKFIRGVGQLQPLEGFDRALTPGAIEAMRMKEYKEQGILLGEWQQKRLGRVAERLELELPW
ncbi:MAG: hypothetical protein GKR89_25135 [Candidatus Latescibacteria bacterium]|nr:hypothetical protein [Candidatus Latescibacterota bacterium]